MAFYLYGDICTYQNGLAIGLSYYNFASIVGAEIKEFGKFFIKRKKRVADAEKKRFGSLFHRIIIDMWIFSKISFILSVHMTEAHDCRQLSCTINYEFFFAEASSCKKKGFSATWTKVAGNFMKCIDPLKKVSLFGRLGELGGFLSPEPKLQQISWNT